MRLHGAVGLDRRGADLGGDRAERNVAGAVGVGARLVHALECEALGVSEQFRLFSLEFRDLAPPIHQAVDKRGEALAVPRRLGLVEGFHTFDSAEGFRHRTGTIARSARKTVENPATSSVGERAMNGGQE